MPQSSENRPPSCDDLALDLTVISFMNSYTQGLSGGDIAFLEFFRRIRVQRHVIVTSKLGQNLCKNSGLDAEFIQTTFEDRFEGPSQTYLLRIVKGLLALLRIPKPDLIYVSSDILPDVLPAVVLKLFWRMCGHRALLFQKIFHVNNQSRRLSAWMQKVSFFLIKQFVDGISTCSELSREVIADTIGLPESSVEVTLLGVDLPRLASIRPAEISYDAVFLGRLHSSKGTDDIVPVWERVVKRFPQATLAIVGHGDEETTARLRDIIESTGLKSRIALLGFVPGVGGLEYIKAATLFLFPSHEEGFGIAIAESMALGTPVVAYDLPVYRKIFGTAIQTSPCFDQAALANQVIDLMQSEVSRKLLADRGLIEVQRLSMNQAAITEHSHLSKLIAHARGPH